MTQVNLGSASNLGVGAGLQAAIAIDSFGTIWLGQNRSLVSYKPATGAIATTSVPETGIDSGLTSWRPSEMSGDQSITAMAAGPSGQLAIASDNSDALQILNTTNGSFTQLVLPTGTEPNDVAYDADGTLGVSESVYSQGHPTTTYNLLIVHPDGTQTNVPDVPTINLTATRSGFLANDSQQFVAASGSLQASPTPTAVGTASGSSIAARAGGWSAVTGTDTIYTSRAGIVVNGTDGSVHVVQLPQFNCGYPSLSVAEAPPTTVAGAGPPQCTAAVGALTANGQGLFAGISTPVPEVAFLSSSHYQ
jgi:hypothetical protein